MKANERTALQLVPQSILRLEDTFGEAGEFQGGIASLVRDDERGHAIGLEASEVFGADDRGIEQPAILPFRSRAWERRHRTRAKEERDFASLVWRAVHSSNSRAVWRIARRVRDKN